MNLENKAGIGVEISVSGPVNYSIRGYGWDPVGAPVGRSISDSVYDSVDGDVCDSIWLAVQRRVSEIRVNNFVNNKIKEYEFKK
jgi:hypothetical protein